MNSERQHFAKSKTNEALPQTNEKAVVGLTLDSSVNFIRDQEV